MTHVLPVSSVDEGHQDALFPIREVSRLTGVNPVTLRAWERRYGLIVPTRTESGHRLYSAADIETVRSIRSWIDRGVAVGKVGKILAGTRNLEGSLRGLHSVIASRSTTSTSVVWINFMDRFFRRIRCRWSSKTWLCRSGVNSPCGTIPSARPVSGCSSTVFCEREPFNACS
jgi:DNA-binding transcriptional MerR regulator